MNGGTVARLPALYTGPDRDHLTRELMPDDHILPIIAELRGMQVRAADARVVRSEQHLPRIRFRHRSLDYDILIFPV